jgi:hypothetical protein
MSQRRAPTSAKSPMRYLLNITGVNAVQFLVLTWFFAPYNSTGLAEHLPSRSGIRLLAALAVTVITAVWFKKSLPPPLTARPLISKRTFILLDRGCMLVSLIAILRLTAPLLHIGSNIALPTYYIWIATLFLATVSIKVLPALIGSVLPSADEVLASDPRKPVLYLRSFEKERSKTGLRGALLPYFQRDPFEGHYMSSGAAGNKYTAPLTHGDSFFGGRVSARGILRADRRANDEQLIFAHAFGAIGPYIALGRPGETYQDMDLGAAKRYVADHEWQAEVERWLKHSAAVVIESANSMALGWEIERVVELVPPTAVLIICPFRDGDYDAFVQRHGRRFPHGVPRDRPRSRLLTFAHDWQPVALQSVESDVRQTLEPFFAQVLATSHAADTTT